MLHTSLHTLPEYGETWLYRKEQDEIVTHHDFRKLSLAEQEQRAREQLVRDRQRGQFESDIRSL